MKLATQITCTFFVVLLLLLVAPTLQAATIVDIISGTDSPGTAQWNQTTFCDAVYYDEALCGAYPSTTRPNAIIQANPVWQQPVPGGMQWVSFDAGTGGSSNWVTISGDFGNPADMTPRTKFFHSFYLPFALNTGNLQVWADDTAAVYLDGNLLMNYSAGLVGYACGDAPISCTPEMLGNISLNGLNQGLHLLQFDVAQLGGGPFGLLYSGSVISDVPEPVTFGLLGISLLGLALVRRPRRP